VEKTDLIVRFAGEGGQGVVTSAEGLAQVAAQVGYNVLTYATFPSQIMGGPTWTQTRISVDSVLSAGDKLDVLVAFNREAYDTHVGEIGIDGVIIYNSEEFELPDQINVLGMPVTQLAKSTGNPRAANMVIIGAIAHLVNMPQNYLNEFVTKRFTRGRTNDEQIISSNIEAMTLGREASAKTKIKLGTLAKADKSTAKQILVKGNEAISLGAVASGLNFYVGYPISPATTILVWMQQNLVAKEKFVYQVSSEIEAITALLGAGFAGRKAMTATAGPGLSLMSEGLGLGWMAEIPCVVDVQRGGPATGLPTKTEQSDLLACFHPAHGDISIPVIAPGSVEECFYATVSAFNWAERYQGPVILMNEMSMAERAQNIPMPELGKLQVVNRSIYNGSNGYMRYAGDSVSPMPIPGHPGSYIANGSEHDPSGDTTHLASRHIEMTQRRFNKLKLLTNGTYESLNKEAPITIMPWGGTKGPSLEAYNLLAKQTTSLSWFYTMFLNPLPETLLTQLRKKELVIVPELNFMGQWSSILRSHGINAISITQYTGLPFKVEDLANRILDVVQSHEKRTVQT